MTSRHFLFFAALAATPAHVRAQAAFLGPGAGYISIGRSQIQTSELDQRLQADGYPTFGQSAANVGIGAYRTLDNHVMLGAEFTGLFIGDETQNGREVGLGGGYATLSIAKQFEMSPRVRVYPRFGLGVGGMGLWIQKADTVGFDAVLASPTPSGRDVVLNRGGGVFDFGLGVELARSRRNVAPLIGLRAGYLLSTFGSDPTWSSYGQTVSGGPNASISGLYARVTLGLAWRR
jgi:hypothetical protein